MYNLDCHLIYEAHTSANTIVPNLYSVFPTKDIKPNGNTLDDRDVILCSRSKSATWTHRDILNLPTIYQVEFKKSLREIYLDQDEYLLESFKWQPTAANYKKFERELNSYTHKDYPLSNLLKYAPLSLDISTEYMWFGCYVTNIKSTEIVNTLPITNTDYSPSLEKIKKFKSVPITYLDLQNSYYFNALEYVFKSVIKRFKNILNKNNSILSTAQELQKLAEQTPFRIDLVVDDPIELRVLPRILPPDNNEWCLERISSIQRDIDLRKNYSKSQPMIKSIQHALSVSKCLPVYITNLGDWEFEQKLLSAK